ncbi:hypothetical protein [Pseudomonas sp.]|uniref:hypothetical protein n=1 Tax=Pseudomonas sp. TaxID=306 RepID=UPI00260065E5|nr:hypothetical protein [Pseudomonas sp.]
MAGFIDALAVAGVDVDIAATRRPKERAFLMHWSWRIFKNGYDPRTVPEYPGGTVEIRWDHPSGNGQYNASASVNAARAMVYGYGIQDLNIAPALNSKHIVGTAIDMSLRWSGVLVVSRANGQQETIETLPRDGMSQRLAVVGATYGVMKYVGGAADKPHWSDNGH